MLHDVARYCTDLNRVFSVWIGSNLIWVKIFRSLEKHVCWNLTLTRFESITGTESVDLNRYLAIFSDPKSPLENTSSSQAPFTQSHRRPKSSSFMHSVGSCSIPCNHSAFMQWNYEVYIYIRAFLFLLIHYSLKPSELYQPSCRQDPDRSTSKLRTWSVVNHESKYVFKTSSRKLMTPSKQKIRMSSTPSPHSLSARQRSGAKSTKNLTRCFTPI